MAPNSSPAMANHAAAATLQTRTPQLQATWERYAETVQHNASTRHPVFFTGKLRRPPSSLGPGTGMSPVAHGYVYQDGRRADGNSAPKL
ncbi:uncharacterized protein LY79DRAFT_173422 [Colletotrichum navitas]|uniref:Uncharacterized protein n=1 Tax=Colletotrichum navitas TaxID=681940 RepID=A0AAD8Q139_9PEZI|nr:uncharacterized protein LY79DRAFT_173422 [Colletotrichum navitas]KAK1593895.1 hypothetical protein LY79DRAFT_173422 [Colletotrichum navitas]